MHILVIDELIVEVVEVPIPRVVGIVFDVVAAENIITFSTYIYNDKSQTFLELKSFQKYCFICKI